MRSTTPAPRTVDPAVKPVCYVATFCAGKPICACVFESRGPESALLRIRKLFRFVLLRHWKQTETPRATFMNQQQQQIFVEAWRVPGRHLYQAHSHEFVTPTFIRLRSSSPRKPVAARLSSISVRQPPRQQHQWERVSSNIKRH